MKGRTALIVALGALAAAGAARAEDSCKGTQAPNASRLVVEVIGVRDAVGEVAITLYPDDRRRFLKRGGKLDRQRLPAAATVRACFWAPPGSYAVAVYHDRDGDRDFDRVLWTPKEGGGFSNNPQARVLPKLADVRFPVNGPERVVQIRMRYP